MENPSPFIDLHFLEKSCLSLFCCVLYHAPAPSPFNGDNITGMNGELTKVSMEEPGKVYISDYR